ncbi:hypothetical protein DSO57_1036202 [Entomophthora muscae]|uniref:Uncharacterized protein n=1 Tax=Entomophthora muscae TaxID=34485 RepID=A0ACC2RQH1_9FUNG|nr:hypothetical protein DSO57_1036202 [Entomophthora muscae]
MATVNTGTVVVLETTHKPYVIDGKGQDDNNKPHAYALWCCWACGSNPNSKKSKYHVIPSAIHKTFIRLIKETWDYKKAAAIFVFWKICT